MAGRLDRRRCAVASVPWIAAWVVVAVSCASPPSVTWLPVKSASPPPPPPPPQTLPTPPQTLPTPTHDTVAEPESAAQGVVISMEDLKSIPVSRSTAPYWESMVRATSDISCDEDLDCDLVRSPCDCVCPRLIRSGKRRRRVAEREVAASCQAATPQCIACERPPNVYRCEAKRCVAIESVLHVTY